MRRLTQALIVSFLLITPIAEAAGQISGMVGERGDLTQMEIFGLENFSTLEIRNQLKADPQVILATHPLAPSAPLLGVVKQRLLMGLQHAGFGDAKVQTEFSKNRNRLIAYVVEGPRFKSGELVIENSKTIDDKALALRLTQPFVPAHAVLPRFSLGSSADVQVWVDKDGRTVDFSEPVWCPGEWAKFDRFSQSRLRSEINHALEDLGYRHARFDIRLENSKNNDYVDLVVSILDEGRLAEIEEIVVRGNAINSTPAILSFLDLAPGALLTRQRETQIHYDLWRSGRFESFDISLLPAFGSKGPTLVLEIEECPEVTPIDHALNKTEEACLKMGRWLSKPEDWKSDMVLQGLCAGQQFSAIFSPEHGCLISSKPSVDNVEASLACAVSSQEIGFYPSDAPYYFRSSSPSQVLGLLLQVESDRDDRTLSLGLLARMKGKEDFKSEAPFNLGFQIDPALCLKIANLDSSRKTWNGDLLTILSDQMVFVVDGQSGRLVNIKIPIEGFEMEVSFVEGEFLRELNRLHKQRDGAKNVCDIEHPISSFCDFLGRDRVYETWSSWALNADASLDRGDVEALRVCAQLLGLGRLDLLSHELLKSHNVGHSRNGFSIPGDPQASQMGWAKRIGFGMVAGGDISYPRGSWIWSINREAGFLLAGNSEYTGRQIQDLLTANKFGPVANWCAATLLESIHPASSRKFADRGISQSGNGFELDYAFLLDQSKPVGQFFLRICETLSAADEIQLSEIQQRLPDPWLGLFRVFIKNLRANPDEEIEARIAFALDALWKAGLNEIVSEGLQDIISRSDNKLAEKSGERIRR